MSEMITLEEVIEPACDAETESDMDFDSDSCTSGISIFLGGLEKLCKHLCLFSWNLKWIFETKVDDMHAIIANAYDLRKFSYRNISQIFRS